MMPNQSKPNKRNLTAILLGVSLLAALVMLWVMFITSQDRNNKSQAVSPIAVTNTALITQPPATLSIKAATITALIAHPPPPHSTETPLGLIVYGRVVDSSGVGIENVSIHRSYASYPGSANTGEIIATTDASGYYVSSFYRIPGDEMVLVWAEQPGVVFEPDNYYWRHYYGYELTACNFTAQP